MIHNNAWRTSQVGNMTEYMQTFYSKVLMSLTNKTVYNPPKPGFLHTGAAPCRNSPLPLAGKTASISCCTTSSNVNGFKKESEPSLAWLFLCFPITTAGLLDAASLSVAAPSDEAVSAVGMSPAIGGSLEEERCRCMAESPCWSDVFTAMPLAAPGALACTS
eukprot:scpid18079/ scgid34591/ 